MDGEELTIQETAQPTISGHLVGVSNIWERDLPDSHGVIASRLSASLTIRNVATGMTRVEKVVAGSVLSLDTDKYIVIDVQSPESMPGSITLRKMP